jgi:ACS family glucarate transporter-like MFS transporter
MLLTVSYGLAGYVQYVFFHWTQYYFSEVLKVGPKESRFYAMLPNVAMAVGMFAGGWIADDLCRRIGPRWGRAGMAVAGLLAGAAFLYCGMIAENPNWIVTWFSLGLGAVGMAEGPYWVTAIELGGRQGGASGAIFNTGGNLGGMIAPVATAWLSEHYDWDVALWATSLACIAAAILWMFIQPGEQTRSLSANAGASG